MNTLRRNPRAALIAIAYFLILLSALEGFRLGIQNSEPSARLRIHAIPVAISELYYGWPHDYTGILRLALPFQQANVKTMDLIRSALAHPPADRHSVYYWTADDRGMADYVFLSFLLFGPHLQSLFAFWFVILVVGVSAFVMTARRDGFALAALCCGLAGVLASLPLYVRALGVLYFGEPSINISESRFFDILGAVPALFLIVSIAHPALLSKRSWYASAAIEVLILAFLLHCRLSMAWLLVAVALVGVGGAFYWMRRKAPRHAARVLIIPALVACGWVGVDAYQRAMFNPAYFGEIGPRTVWHNILMGLAYNPRLASELQMKVDDHSAVRAVLRYMEARHDPRLTPEWNETTILDSLGSINRFDWVTYEQAARELVLDTLAAHPLSAIKLVAFDKPRAIAIAVCNAMLLCPSKPGSQVTRANVRFDPTSGLMLAISVAIAAMLALVPDRARPGFLFGSLAVVCVLSLAPSLIFYPGITQLGGLFVFGATLLYLAIAHFLAAFLRRHPAFQAARSP